MMSVCTLTPLRRLVRAGGRAMKLSSKSLWGVRSEQAERVAADDDRRRLYTPFGVDWWPYAIRRLGENPANTGLLARSLLS